MTGISVQDLVSVWLLCPDIDTRVSCFLGFYIKPTPTEHSNPQAHVALLNHVVILML